MNGTKAYRAVYPSIKSDDVAGAAAARRRTLRPRHASHRFHNIGVLARFGTAGTARLHQLSEQPENICSACSRSWAARKSCGSADRAAFGGPYFQGLQLGIPIVGFSYGDRCYWLPRVVDRRQRRSAELQTFPDSNALLRPAQGYWLAPSCSLQSHIDLFLENGGCFWNWSRSGRTSSWFLIDEALPSATRVAIARW